MQDPRYVQLNDDHASDSTYVEGYEKSVQELDWWKKEKVGDAVLFEKNPKTKIATITFNRPETLNGFKQVDYIYINELLYAINEDDDVKVVILKGNGKAFSGGHDVGELRSMFAGGKRRVSQRQKIVFDHQNNFGRHGCWVTLATLFKATISQVHGYCMGSGLYFALASDLVISTPDCKFGHPGWRDVGPISAWQLIMRVGVLKAKEMMLTCRHIGAQEALDYRLINHVVPADQVDDEVQQMAERVAKLPLDAIVIGKMQFEAALDTMGMHQGYGSMSSIHSFATNLRLEPGELNLMKIMRDEGVKKAIQTRKAYWGEYDGPKSSPYHPSNGKRG